MKHGRHLRFTPATRARFVTAPDASFRTGSGAFAGIYSALLGTAFLLVGATLQAADAPDLTRLPPPASGPIDFKRDIQPLLQAHCLSCHGADKQRGGLLLENRASALKGGENHAPDIRPGDSASSPLIHFVAGLVPDWTMPPKGEPLTAEQVGLLRAWIDQGAVWPDDPGARREIHWALRPVQRPAVPPLPDGSQAANPVDAFILDGLRRKGLTPSPPADRRQFVRRLYLVLHGVPPTPAEVDAFVQDARPDAFERLVDRVLADPRYGERWARHWLDVVRYAESNGFETNRERKTAYPYRDYVIRSLNEDLPYDQFVREQVAGDAFGSDAATGFLVAGAYDIVKSPDINLTLMQRQDELADIVNTTGTAFLGLTVGCARCHDHKFDPISQKDYYAIQAVFAGVNFADRPLRKSLDAAEKASLAAARDELATAEAALKALRTQAASAAPDAALRPPVNGQKNEEEFAPVEAVALRFEILATNGGEPCLDELEVYDDRGTNVALASLGTRPTASGTLPGYAIHQLEHLNDGRPGNDRSWISSTPGKGWVRLDFAQPVTVRRVVWGRDRAGQFKDRVATDYRIEVIRATGPAVEVASSRTRQAMGSADPDAFLRSLSDSDARRARDLKERVQALNRQIAGLVDGMPVWAGTFSQPTNTHRLYRGDPLQPREVVSPDAIAVLGKIGLAVDAPEQERRIRFAEWLTRPEHPLTARVMANRVWHYLFGSGLVDTPSDFGINGGVPSNPALLDWLADELVRGGWSLKRLQRTILLSDAFRQSSVPRAEALDVDAEARLLWRFPPRRLEAEIIRDSMLATSGVLDRRMGGPGFHLQKVEEDNVYRYFPKEEFGPAEFRRMVYLTRIRQEQDSVFGAFDCPSGNQVMPKRTRSNTPLQALNLFNGGFVLQQAGFLADRLTREAGSEPRAQVEQAFEWVYGRPPDEYERDASVELVRTQGLAAFCRALYNTSEFLFIF